MQEVRIFRSAGHEFKQFGFHAKLHGIQFFHSFFFFLSFFLTSWEPLVMLSRSFGDQSVKAGTESSEEKKEGWVAFI
jgi:hypothetical protein